MLDLSGIVQDSIVDGPGIRTTVFSQGCPHHCEGCHNPETWEFGCGTPMEEERILEIVRSNPLCRGVTFSGGEPFAQAADCARLAKAAHAVGWTVWTYTGYLFETILAKEDPAWRALLEETDVLVDGPFLEKEKSYELRFRGSRNQRLIRVKESLAQGKAVLWTQSDPLAKFTIPES